MYTAQVLTKFSAYLLINKRTQKYRENKKQILLLFVHSFLATISKAATSKVLLANGLTYILTRYYKISVKCSDNHLCSSYLPMVNCWKMIRASCCEQPVLTMTFSKIQQRFHDAAQRWSELHVANSQCSRWHFQGFNKGSTMLLKKGQSFMLRTIGAHHEKLHVQVR